MVTASSETSGITSPYQRAGPLHKLNRDVDDDHDAFGTVCVTVVVCEHIRHRSAAARLLQSAAHRRDALSVEAEPVHSSDITGVLDLDASIHHDRETAGFRDPRAVLVDHHELTPHVFRADRHGL